MKEKLTYGELQNLAIELYRQLDVLKQFVDDNILQDELVQYLQDNISMKQDVEAIKAEVMLLAEYKCEKESDKK